MGHSHSRPHLEPSLTQGAGYTNLAFPAASRPRRSESDIIAEVASHRQYSSSMRSRHSSRCHTPRSVRSHNFKDPRESFRLALSAVHSICENKDQQIEALCKSLGTGSHRDGPDAGLAAKVYGFDHAAQQLARKLKSLTRPLHSQVLSTKSPRTKQPFDIPLDLHEFNKDIVKAAIDVEHWFKHFRALVFPATMDKDRRKAGSKLRYEAKVLGKRCFVLTGKMEAMCLVDLSASTEVSSSAGTINHLEGFPAAGLVSPIGSTRRENSRASVPGAGAD